MSLPGLPGGWLRALLLQQGDTPPTPAPERHPLLDETTVWYGSEAPTCALCGIQGHSAVICQMRPCEAPDGDWCGSEAPTCALCGIQGHSAVICQMRPCESPDGDPCSCSFPADWHDEAVAS